MQHATFCTASLLTALLLMAGPSRGEAPVPVVMADVAHAAATGERTVLDQGPQGFSRPWKVFMRSACKAQVNREPSSAASLAPANVLLMTALAPSKRLTAEESSALRARIEKGATLLLTNNDLAREGIAAWAELAESFGIQSHRSVLRITGESQDRRWHVSVHKIDVARWGLGVDFPRRVSSCGAKLYFADDGETPDTHLVNYDFGDKILTFENRNWHRRGFEGTAEADIAFYGDRGSLIISGGSYKVYDQENHAIGEGSGRAGDADHIANLVDAIRQGTPLSAGIEVGYRSALLCHLGSIAHRTGHTLTCDPQTGRILDDPAAQQLWSREYESGWESKLTAAALSFHAWMAGRQGKGNG